MCGADLTNVTAEKLLMSAWRTVSYATEGKLSALRIEASACLTDKRLIVIPLKWRGKDGGLFKMTVRKREEWKEAIRKLSSFAG